ncbi:MAG: hypothetical protein JNK43_07565 [Ignavibacteria bacterium]|nr:hypothetical protein [Ignavibacteria bacterium]
MLDSFEEGYFLGLLVGEGHFGGDGRKAQVTLRMHTRHDKLFYWLVEKFPGSKLYGPYNHGGRHYFQWMARGEVLKNEILPIIFKNWDVIDDHVQSRITEMCTRYKLPVSMTDEESDTSNQSSNVPPESINE